MIRERRVRARVAAGVLPLAKEHGKNNFGETKVAITLRGMISRRYSEVVFPVFLRKPQS